jgi:Sodium/hydrogen exchanger family
LFIKHNRFLRKEHFEIKNTCWRRWFFHVFLFTAFHASKTLSKLFPESCLLIVIGVVLGVILYFADQNHDHQLQTHTFFLLILPPIIIDAGYFMPSRAFFDQFGTIILFAVFGTLVINTKNTYKRPIPVIVPNVSNDFTFAFTVAYLYYNLIN